MAALDRAEPLANPARSKERSLGMRTAMAVGTSLLLLIAQGAGTVAATQEDTGGLIVVDQHDPTAVSTITRSLALARDGDTILVRPGTYAEAIVIDKDVTLAGDGPRDEIIIEAPATGPDAPTADISDTGIDAPYALLLQGVDATITDLSIQGEPSHVHIDGGSPVLEGLLLRAIEPPYRGVAQLGGVLVLGGSTATIRGNTFDGGSGVRSYDGSDPLVVDNVLRGGASIAGDYGDRAVIRGNTVVGDALQGIAIFEPSTALVEGNTITGASTGIVVGEISTGVDPIVRDNVVCGTGTGITVAPGAAPTVDGNTVVGSRFGLSLVNDGLGTVSNNDFIDNDIGMSIGRSNARISANSVVGGNAGIVITDDSTVAVSGNVIEQAGTHGIVVGRGSSPTLTDNRICGGSVSLRVEDGADPVIGDNEVCPPAPTK